MSYDRHRGRITPSVVVCVLKSTFLNELENGLDLLPILSLAGHKKRTETFVPALSKNNYWYSNVTMSLQKDIILVSIVLHRL